MKRQVREKTEYWKRVNKRKKRFIVPKIREVFFKEDQFNKSRTIKDKREIMYILEKNYPLYQL